MFKVSQKGARKWLEGEALPHTSRLVQIAARCGVSAEWLLSGHGAMRPDHGTARPPGVSEPRASYRAPSPRLRRLLALVMEAEADGRLERADIEALERILLRLLRTGS